MDQQWNSWAIVQTQRSVCTLPTSAPSGILVSEYRHPSVIFLEPSSCSARRVEELCGMRYRSSFDCSTTARRGGEKKSKMRRQRGQSASSLTAARVAAPDRDLSFGSFWLNFSNMTTVIFNVDSSALGKSHSTWKLEFEFVSL